jgi:hypothetical protein
MKTARVFSANSSDWENRQENFTTVARVVSESAEALVLAYARLTIALVQMPYMLWAVALGNVNSE